MLRGDEIADIVEKRFRTPISVEKRNNDIIAIRLSDLSRNEGFVLTIQKTWRRITFETKFERFAGELLKTIEESPVEAKDSFANLYLSFPKTTHLTLLVNHCETPIDSFKDGKSKITSFQIRSELKNIEFTEIDQKVLIQICAESVWQILCLMMIFLQKKISDDYSPLKEGTEIEKTVKEYERNPVYRDIVIALKGTACSVCNMQYKDKYGAYGEDFIEMHHVTPVSKIKHGHKFDPLTDLVPVCSNCHAIIHRQKIHRTISDVQNAIKRQSDI